MLRHVVDKGTDGDSWLSAKQEWALVPWEVRFPPYSSNYGWWLCQPPSLSGQQYAWLQGG